MSRIKFWISRDKLIAFLFLLCKYNNFRTKLREPQNAKFQFQFQAH